MNDVYRVPRSAIGLRPGRRRVQPRRRLLHRNARPVWKTPAGARPTARVSRTLGLSMTAEVCQAGLRDDDTGADVPSSSPRPGYPTITATRITASTCGRGGHPRRPLRDGLGAGQREQPVTTRRNNGERISDAQASKMSLTLLHGATRCASQHEGSAAAHLKPCSLCVRRQRSQNAADAHLDSVALGYCSGRSKR